MGFNLIAPKAKASTSAFRITSAQLRKGGDWRLVLSIPSAEYTLRFGTAEQFDLLMGDGEDAGKLMIRANRDGGFRPTMLKHCAIFRLPPTEGAPQGAFSMEDPERQVVADGIIIELPEWAWKPDRWQEILKARDVNARQQQAAGLTRRDALDRIGKIGGK